MNLAAPQILTRQRHRLDALAASLRALDPKAVLGRGYAVVRQARGIVATTGAVSPALPMHIEFADGEVTARVTDIAQRENCDEKDHL